MTDRELMQMALDALDSWQKTCLDCGRGSDELGRATQPIKALRGRLAKPEPEPVAWITEWNGNYSSGKLLDWVAHARGVTGKHTPLYTEPPKREWVGLTDGDKVDLLKEYEGRLWTDIFQAIEAKLKEKNT